MNTIEQAAKRLAELKRAGYDVPAPDLPQAAVSPAGMLPVPDSEPDSEPAPAVVAAAAAPLPAVRSASLPGEPIARRRSREVQLDLERLERDGYLVPTQARSQLAEQMRLIKRPLLANARGESAQQISRANLIQVVSAMPGEGKTFFAINLAMSIAMEVDLSVLLVDADVLRPSVLARCGIEPARGLMDVLKTPSIDLADVMLRTNVPKLSLLPAGTAHSQSTELLASTAMERLLDEVASRFPDRIIVFDAPPLIPTTESRVLASRVGQVVMVVEAGKTTHAQVTQAYAAVEQCPVVLSVLNRAIGKSGEAYGYYYAS
jgi:receptor protein-tyrosine kinase